MRYSTTADKLSDKKLVECLEELLTTKVALEATLTSALSEYQNRRVKRVRAGEGLWPLDVPLALDANARQSMSNRERIAADHHKADEQSRRDPFTRGLIGA